MCACVLQDTSPTHAASYRAAAQQSRQSTAGNVQKLYASCLHTYTYRLLNNAQACHVKTATTEPAIQPTRTHTRTFTQFTYRHVMSKVLTPITEPAIQPTRPQTHTYTHAHTHSHTHICALRRTHLNNFSWSLLMHACISVSVPVSVSVSVYVSMRDPFSFSLSPTTYSFSCARLLSLFVWIPSSFRRSRQFITIISTQNCSHVSWFGPAHVRWNLSGYVSHKCVCVSNKCVCVCACVCGYVCRYLCGYVCVHAFEWYASD